MAVDPTVRRSILQLLHVGRKDEELRIAAVAKELDLGAELVEAYLDVLEQEGLVEVARRFGGNHAVQLTSRGLLEAKSEPEGRKMPADGADREKPTQLGRDPSAARRRLQEQLDQLAVLRAEGHLASVEHIKDWVEWTSTVLKNIFGAGSGKSDAFNGVMLGPWPWGYDSAQAEGYWNRLPEWERLLKTWIREIDEFATPGEVAEQYIPPKSQFDAYGALKDKVKGAVGSVTLVDPYTDDATLRPLLSVDVRVSVRVLTVNPSADFAHALELFRKQWGGNVEARRGPKELHDRFLLVDDRVFVSGASFKDLGRRGSVLTEVGTQTTKEAIRKDIEASWEAAQPIA